MRVCHIISSFRPVIGGAERATETLVHALREEGVDAIVVTRRYSREHPSFERVRGIPVHRLGWPGRGKVNAASFAAHSFLFLTRDLRGYGILHVQNIDTPMLLGMIAKVLLRRRLVATIHGETQIFSRGETRLGRRRMDAMARAVDAFTSINPRNTKALTDVGVPRERIHEIPNGIDTDVFRPPTADERQQARADLGLSDGDFVAVYIGRLQPYKRVDLLIDAWKGLRDPDAGVLLVVGEGPEVHGLRERARPLGDRVRLVGPSDAPVRYLHAADVFVNASGDPRTAWSEGLSVALLEAMASGVMPIVTAGPGNDVLVEHGVTGLSFPVGDRRALLDRLSMAIADPGLRARLADQAHDRVSRTYSSAAVARLIARVYGEVT